MLPPMDIIAADKLLSRQHFSDVHASAITPWRQNLQYGHAGLVRAPLEMSLTSELATRGLLDRMRKKPN